MKLKYIFSMFAGLLVMTTASCKEEVSAEADKEPTTEKKADAAATAKSADETPKTGAATAASSAYYVMFKGDGG